MRLELYVLNLSDLRTIYKVCPFAERQNKKKKWEFNYDIEEPLLSSGSRRGDLSEISSHDH